MTSSIAVSAVVLLFVAQSGMSKSVCTEQHINYNTYAGSKISVETDVEFSISEIQPNQTGCDELTSICASFVQTGTIISFRGAFPPSIIREVSVSGTDRSLNIPVILVGGSYSIATPPIAVFRTVGPISFADAMDFRLAIFGESFLPTSTNVIPGTLNADCPANSFCYNFNGRNLKLWGSRALLTSLTVTGLADTRVFIPFVDAGTRDDNPIPLVVPVDGIIQGHIDLMIPFVVRRVIYFPPGILNTPNCVNDDACYDLTGVYRQALFKGVMPTTQMTFTHSGQNGRIVHVFGERGTMAQRSFVASMVLSVSLYLWQS